MGLIAGRRKGFEKPGRRTRLMRLLRLYDENVPVKEIARMEKLSRARIYQLLNEALATLPGGVNGA